MGYSFGGYVAYEMVCQLTEAGQEISHLILLDPGVTWLEKLRFVKAVYRPMRYENNVKKGWSRLTRAVPSALGLSAAPSDLDEAHFAALLKYRPKPMALQNVLFVSALENKQRNAIRHNWAKMIGSGVTFADATGNHAHMVREPNIWAMAQKIEAWLDSGSTATDDTPEASADLRPDPGHQASARAA